MKAVNRSVRKKDAMQLLTGQPVYTDDLAPKDCLVVKLLRSPHANAWVEQIDTAAALRVPMGWRLCLPGRMCPRKGRAIPRLARPIRNQAPTTGWSSTAMSALWGTW